MNIYKKSATLSALAAVLVFSVMTACSFGISESRSGSKKARLLLSKNTTARFIGPESDIEENDITKAELKIKVSAQAGNNGAGSSGSAGSGAAGNGSSSSGATDPAQSAADPETRNLKIWESTESQSAFALMKGESKLLMDAGTYDFTLNLYITKDNEYVLCQTGVLEGFQIHAGDNHLEFDTQYAADGTGDLLVTFSIPEDAGIDKVYASLYPIDEKLIADADAYDRTLVYDASASENSLTYAKYSVPAGNYSLIVEVLDADGVVLNTFDDGVRIAATCTSKTVWALSNINTRYTLTYIVNRYAVWKNSDGIIKANELELIPLPGEDKITLKNYELSGWSTEPEGEGTVYLPGDKVSITQVQQLYAVWRRVFFIKYENCENIPASIIHSGESFTPPVPEREGYTFVAWYKDGTVYDETEAVLEDFTLTAKWLNGTGSAAYPWVLENMLDWNNFTENINSGNTYEGKYFKLGADIGSEEEPVTAMIGFYSTTTSECRSFAGTLDGNGKTLTVKIAGNENEDYVAPFRYVKSGTFKNLIITGEVSSNSYYGRDEWTATNAGGLIGVSHGTDAKPVVIDNCVSYVTLKVTVRGTSLFDANSGGFVGDFKGKLEISNTEFRGELTCEYKFDDTYKGCQNCCGFAYSTNSSTATLTNCLFAPSVINKMTGSNFANGNNTYTRCYYTKRFGASSQGTAIVSIDEPNDFYAPTLITYKSGSLYGVKEVSCTGISSDYIITSSSPLTLSGISFSLKAGETLLTSGTAYTAVFKTRSGETVSGNKITGAGIYTIEFTGKGSYAGTIQVPFTVYKDLDGSGTEEDPFLIKSEGDWISFSKKIEEKDTFEGKFIKLTADIGTEEFPITKVAGKYNTSDAREFKGTFDGDGHTITVAINEIDNYAAPFAYVTNGTVKNLKVKGTVTATRFYVGGVIGKLYKTTVENCIVYTEINGSGYDTGGIVGDSTEGTIKDCAFFGKIIDNGSYTGSFSPDYGGIIGDSSSSYKSLITGCLFAPSQIAAPMNTTFPYYSTIQNCFYTKNFGNVDNQIFVCETLPPGAVGEPVIFTYPGHGENGTDLTLTYYKLLPVESLTGSGTEQDPYLIRNIYEYNCFADNAGTYSGKYIRLEADIGTDEEPATKNIRTFSGTFDGNGHTLNVSLTPMDECKTCKSVSASSYNDTKYYYYYGLFNYLANATIKNLSITGTVMPFFKSSSSANNNYYFCGGGLVGYACSNVTIENVCSSVELKSYSNHDSNLPKNCYGGFIGYSEESVIKNCAFTGKFTVGSNARSGQIGKGSGFIGYPGFSNEVKIKLDNCLFDPAGYNMEEDVSYSYTFVNDFAGVRLTNCYYTQALKKVYNEYGYGPNAAGVYKCYAYDPLSFCTFKEFFGKKYYIPTTCMFKGLKETYTYTGSEIIPDYILKIQGTNVIEGADYTLHMQDDRGNTVTRITEGGRYFIVLTSTGTGGILGSYIQPFMVLQNLLGSGTEEDPYLIENDADWEIFATNVTYGNSYKDKYIKITRAIGFLQPLTIMAGDVEKDRAFSGTLDGNNKTLSIHIRTDEKYAAPFRLTDGASFKNLKIAGTVNSGEQYAGALIGQNKGNTLIENCDSSVTITSRYSGTAYCSGFAASNDGSSTLTFTDCMFTGKLLGTGASTYNGFASGGTVNLTRCLSAPVEITMNNDQSCMLTNSTSGTSERAFCIKSDSAYTRGETVYISSSEIPLTGTNAAVKFYKQQVLKNGVTYYTPLKTDLDGFMPIYDWNDGNAVELGITVIYDGSAVPQSNYSIEIKDAGGNNIQNNIVTQKGKYTITYTGTGPDYYGRRTDTFTVRGVLAGSGTEEDPYLVQNLTDWQSFSDRLNDGYSYTGEFIKLTADIGTAEAPVTETTAQNTDFEGTLDGSGFTVTYDITGVALFKYIKNACFRNLRVTGNLSSTDGNNMGGIVYFSHGNTSFEHCICSVAITSAYQYQQLYIGGFMYSQYTSANRISFADCVFNGKFLGNKVDVLNSFIGSTYQSSNISCEHCISAPSEINITYNYYTNLRGTTQSDCYCTRDDDNKTNGNLTNAYETAETVPDGTFCKKENFAGVYYYVEKDTYVTGYEKNYDWTGSELQFQTAVKSGNDDLTEGTDYTVSITDENGQEVTSISARGFYTLIVRGKGIYAGSKSDTFAVKKAIPGSGTESDPYLISNMEEYESFAWRISSGNRYSGKFIKLGADIGTEQEPVSVMAGSIDDQKPFSGTFDGNGHTLTLNIDGQNQSHTAPFRYASNAEFKNLKIAGAVSSSSSNISGLIGKCTDCVFIKDCVSSVAITYTGTGYAQKCAGFAGENSGKAFISGCVFNGSFLSPNSGTKKSNSSAGFIYSLDKSYVQMSKLLFAPKEIDNGYEGSNTFRNGSGSYSYYECYYTPLSVFRSDCGTQIYADSAAVPEGVICRYYEDYGAYIPCTLTALAFENADGYTVEHYELTSCTGEPLKQDIDFTITALENNKVMVEGGPGSSCYGSSTVTVEAKTNSFNMPYQYNKTLTKVVNLTNCTDITGTSFKVYDDGGPTRTYRNNYNGYIQFVAPQGSKLKLEGKIYTESSFDYIAVWDSDYITTYNASIDNSGLLLLEKTSSKKSGTGTVIDTVTTASNTLYIYFHSDSSSNYSGLDLTVTIIE